MIIDSALIPLNTVALIGSNTTFACEISGAQGNQINWYFREESNIIASSCRTIPSSPYTAWQDGAVCHLDITSVTSELAGVYACRQQGPNTPIYDAELVVIGEKTIFFLNLDLIG